MSPTFSPPVQLTNHAGKCPRCGGSVQPTRDLDNLAKQIGVCLNCGWEEGGAVVRVTDKPAATPNGDGDMKRRRLELAPAALEPETLSILLARFNGAAAALLELHGKWQAAVQREADLRRQVSEAEAAMAQARAKLDSGLAGLSGPSGAVAGATEKPEQQKPTPRPRGSKLPEKPCAVCGKLYQPSRRNQIYCSHACGQQAVLNREREARAKAEAEPVALAEVVATATE